MYDEIPAIDIQQIFPTSAPGLFVIGANCIANINGEFFLALEVESTVPGAEEIEPLIFIRLTDEQATALINSGVSSCTITNVPPTPIPGLNVEFKCIVVLNGQAFEVFDVEDSIDVAVLVRTRSCPVISEPFEEEA